MFDIGRVMNVPRETKCSACITRVFQSKRTRFFLSQVNGDIWAFHEFAVSPRFLCPSLIMVYMRFGDRDVQMQDKSTPHAG